MRIAAVSITRNDNIRIGYWAKYYEEYKDELYRHIIVDNNSSDDYKKKLRSTFPNSEIIELPFNGACTIAYNRGISLALEDPDVDAISLIGNDVRIERGGLSKLYNLLYSDPTYGMVGPVVLHKDSDVIQSFGASLHPKTGIPTILNRDKNISDFKDITMEVGYVAGGASISKRAFYETSGVGLQDENLFMYGDERDMALRAKERGYKEIATSTVLAWHQHINNGGERSPMQGYLMARNFVYIQKKFFSKKYVLRAVLDMLMKRTLIFIRDIRKKNSRQDYYNIIRGLKAGMKGDMDNSNINMG